MTEIIDNIIIGTPLMPEDALGILPHENTIRLELDDVRNHVGEVFLPTTLTRLGIVSSNGQLKQINKQRQGTEKIRNNPDQNLWRNLDKPEMTPFKIGKRSFWLIVGE